MVHARTIGTPLLLVHGLLMLSLGMVLFSLASIMIRPSLEEFGYTVAAILTSVCLLAGGYISYRGGLWSARSPGKDLRLYLIAGVLSIVSGALFWMSHSATANIHALTVLTGVYGIYWGMWNLGLALHLQGHLRKAIVLCGFAGITSAFSLMLATEFQFNDLDAITELACFVTLIGIQGLVITLYLYKSMELRTNLESDLVRDA